MDPIELEVKKKEDGTLYFDVAKLAEHMQKGTQSTLSAIKAEMKEQLQAEVHQIFDNSDGRFLDKEGKSVIDTSFFNRKHYENPRGGLVGDSEMAQKLRASGGPFIKLSPAMERFANFVVRSLKVKGDMNALQAGGFSLMDYNKEIVEWNKKAAPDTLTTGDVGAIVPIEFIATVIEFAIQMSEILPKLWRIPMGSMTTRIPTLAQTAGSYFGGIVMYHPKEAAEKFETKPGFSYKEFTAHKLIGLCPVSDELVMDSNINIINYITALFTRAFQYNTEGEVISGRGAAYEEFMGIVNDPNVNYVDRDTAGTVKRVDVLALESVIDENVQDLAYLTRRATINILRQEKGSTGVPVYYDTTVAGLGERLGSNLNGYPAFRTRNVPSVGHKGDLVCGDLGYYLWALRQDMTIDMSKERWFEYDITALRFVMRQDGKAGVPLAFAVLKGPAQS